MTVVIHGITSHHNRKLIIWHIRMCVIVCTIWTYSLQIVCTSLNCGQLQLGTWVSWTQGASEIIDRGEWENAGGVEIFCSREWTMIFPVLASFFARSQFTLCILTMLRSMHSATGDLADSSRRRNWYHNHWNYHRGLLATDPVPRGEWVWSIVVTWLYLALGICWVQELGKEPRKRAIHSQLHNDQWYLWQLLSWSLLSLSSAW